MNKKLLPYLAMFVVSSLTTFLSIMGFYVGGFWVFVVVVTK